MSLWTLRYLCLLVLVIGLPKCILSDNDRSSLKLVHVLYRHGDRTPIDPYPNDPYKDRINWPVGFGELTPIGKMMQFNLGQYLRKRYDGFLPERFDEDDIYVRSTDYNRTLMSAYCNLAGLYPPKDDQIWNKNLLWQPIPVHTVPAEYDNFLAGHEKCLRMEKLVEEVWECDELKAINEENKEMYQYLTEHSGRNITNIGDVGYLYDTFFIETRYNKTLPTWAPKYFPDKMKPLADLSFKISTWTHELKRLRNGLFIQELIKHFDDPNLRLKFFMYSAHDSTVASVLNTLGLFDPPIGPPYASCLMFEYYTEPVPSLELYYRNSSEADPVPLTIPGCSAFRCPIQEFKSLTANLIPTDWHNECQNSSDETVSFVLLFSVLISSVLALILVMSVIYACISRAKSQKEDLRYFKIAPDFENSQ